MHTNVIRVMLGLCLLAATGCGEPGHDYNAKETIPVQGRVTVDGKPPGSPVKISCHPVDGPDVENPSITQALTDDEGVFHLSTYKAGDGIPKGEYKLTFFWGKFNEMSMGFGGPDRLKDRYNEPEKSPVTLTVEDSDPIDLGEISLTTK